MADPRLDEIRKKHRLLKNTYTYNNRDSTTWECSCGKWLQDGYGHHYGGVSPSEAKRRHAAHVIRVTPKPKTVVVDG